MLYNIHICVYKYIHTYTHTVGRMLPLFAPPEQRLCSPKSPGEIPEHCLGVAPDKQKKEERKEEQSQVFVTVLTALELCCFLYLSIFSKGFVKVGGDLCYSLSLRQARN